VAVVELLAHIHFGNDALRRDMRDLDAEEVGEWAASFTAASLMSLAPYAILGSCRIFSGAAEWRFSGEGIAR
jgi:hypothetical protein